MRRSLSAHALGAGVILALVCACAVAIGSVAIDWPAVLAGRSTDAQHAIVFDLRLPRVILAALSGAALATAGTMMQALFRNPLADPALTGVSAGAAIGAIAAIVFGAHLAPFEQPLCAFAAALATTGLLLLYARRDTVATLLLAGIAINALAAAAIGAMTWIADDAKLRNLAFWLLGSFGNASWPTVFIAAPWLIAPVVAVPYLSRAMNALLLGEIEASYLGYRVARLRAALVALTALAVGASVASAGAIGFIGLVVPHMMRTLVGPDHGRLLPLVALVGASLAVAADLASRALAAPSEIPVGVLLATLGAPMFLWLLKRQPRD